MQPVARVPPHQQSVRLDIWISVNVSRRVTIAVKTTIITTTTVQVSVSGPVDAVMTSTRSVAHRGATCDVTHVD
jgi:hypothetical protein